MMSMQVDRIKQNKIEWNSDYVNPNSQAYRVLEDESVYAVSISTLFLKFSNLSMSKNISSVIDFFSPFKRD